MDDMEGSGTEEDPYKIERLEQLQDVRQKLDACYRLISNIDATHTEQEFEPIGDDENPFTGTFDGNNYEIRNLSIKQPEQDIIGLFGCIGEKGQVENLGLADSSIEGRPYIVGGLIGRSNRGRVESSYAVNVDVSGEKYVGGLIGRNYRGRVESSYAANVDVSGEKYVGGLVGYNGEDRVESSYTIDSNVSGEKEVGGLIGTNRGEVESSCAVNVDVSGEEYVGGLVGSNWEVVDSSYVHKRNISGNRDVGDLVGYQYTKPRLENSYVLSKLDNPNSLEEPDLVLLRENHRILYIVEAKTLYLQIDDEIYSRRDVSPIVVQSLVDDETEVLKMTQNFMSSLVITT